MILGEVEYIGYKDKNGQFVSEDSPDVTQVKYNRNFSFTLIIINCADSWNLKSSRKGPCAF